MGGGGGGWALPTSELVTPASCGHTVTAHVLTSGKIKLYCVFQIPEALLQAPARELGPLENPAT